MRKITVFYQYQIQCFDKDAALIFFLPYQLVHNLYVVIFSCGDRMKRVN